LSSAIDFHSPLVGYVLDTTEVHSPFQDVALLTLVRIVFVFAYGSTQLVTVVDALVRH
jgi:hypothetical protein